MSLLNNEKMKQAADTIMILDYNQYVSKYLSVYVCVHVFTQLKVFYSTLKLHPLMPFVLAFNDHFLAVFVASANS